MVNNTVDRINDFNSKFIQRFTKSIVIVKKTTNKQKNNSTLYIVVPTTEEETKKIIINRLLSEEIIQQILNQSLIKNKDNIISCAFCGNLNDFTSYNSLVYQYPLKFDV